jgi:3'(2'), 5'-bisphosphate nucleotidase
MQSKVSRQELPPELHQSIRAWLPSAIDIARQAGQKILHVYESSYEITNKKDNTPVTCADLAANELIVEQLSQLTPDLPVLSEESVEVPYSERQNWETFWLVDPLDGTRAFIERTGEFTVNIALIHRHYPVIGVIYSPVRGCTFYACQGYGAFNLNPDNETRAISVRKKCADPLVVAGTRSSRSRALLEFLNNLEKDFKGYETIFMGSSFKSCLVAAAEADLYVRLGPTSEWDTAAAQCIVEEAGGLITDTHMQPLQYNMRESLLNPHFFVFGDTSIQWNKYLPD